MDKIQIFLFTNLAFYKLSKVNDHAVFLYLLCVFLLLLFCLDYLEGVFGIPALTSESLPLHSLLLDYSWCAGYLMMLTFIGFHLF